jgi:diadenosine tetraphosphate (Ap4A) HIT family hydrolase
MVAENDLAYVVRDAFPVSPGHTLVIPRRHIASFFQISEAEKANILHLLEAEKRRLDEECRPDGYNIGFNDGAAAGQTIPHLHIHLIPRYQGDQADPRGGVRWIFPAKVDYWSS